MEYEELFPGHVSCTVEYEELFPSQLTHTDQSQSDRAIRDRYRIIIITTGAAPTDVTAEQDGLDTVQVTWTPPPAPPAAGYQVQVIVGTITTTKDTKGTSHTISVNQFGVYSIRVMSLFSSQHFPSEATAPVELTVRGTGISYVVFYTISMDAPAGTLAPIIFSTQSPAATSVSITWTQPEFSLPLQNYTVSLTRVTGSSQVLCPSVMDSRPSVTTMATVTSMEFTGLKEFSTYTVTVTASFSAFGMITDTSTSMGFTTLSTGITQNMDSVHNFLIMIY